MGTLAEDARILPRTGTRQGDRLTVRLRHWKNLPTTLDQPGKDRACLDNTLE